MNSMEQILQLAKRNSVTAYEIAENTGLSEPGIRKILQGKTKRPSPGTIKLVLEFLEKKYGGKEKIFIEPKPEYQTGYPKKRQLQKYTEGGVPFYGSDITSHIVSSFNDIKEIPEYYIDVSPLNDCDAWFTNRGDSMYPKYRNGQQLAVKTIHNYEAILWGESYLIITNSEANNLRTVKNIFQHEDKEKIILRAVNPDYQGDTVLYKKNILSIHMVKGDLNISHN